MPGRYASWCRLRQRLGRAANRPVEQVIAVCTTRVPKPPIVEERNSPGPRTSTMIFVSDHLSCRFGRRAFDLKRYTSRREAIAEVHSLEFGDPAQTNRFVSHGAPSTRYMRRLRAGRCRLPFGGPLRAIHAVRCKASRWRGVHRRYQRTASSSCRAEGRPSLHLPSDRRSSMRVSSHTAAAL